MKIVSKDDQTTKALEKRIKELEATIIDIREDGKKSLELSNNFNIVSENANTLYTINDFDINCRFTYVSPSVKKIGGYEPEELIGKSCFDYIHPEDKKNIVLPLLKSYLSYKVKNLLKGELKDNSQTYTYRLKDKMGNWRYAETTSNFLGNKLVNITTDIGDKKEYEKKLQKSKVDYANLLSNLNDIYYRVNKEGLITDINPAVERITGHLPEKLIGNPVKNVFKEQNDRYDFISSIKKNGIVKNHKLVFTKTDGNKIYVTTNAYIVKDDNGNPIGIEGVLHDVTKDKLLEKALLENTKELDSIYNGVKNGIALLDKTGKILRINKAIVDIGGFSEKEIIGKRFSVLKMFPAKSISKMILAFSKLIKGEEVSYEMEASTKKGEKKIIQIHNTLIKREGKLERIVVILRDITEAKLSEDKLLKSEQKYKDLVEKSNIAILTEDNDGNFIYFNESFHELFGYTADEIKKTNNSDLVHPDDYKKVMEYHKKRIDGKKVPSDYEHRAIKKDGSIIYLSLNVIPVIENNKIVGTHSYIWDVTDRMLTENALKVNEEKLKQAQKISQIGYYNLSLKTGMWTSSAELNNIFGIDNHFKRDLNGAQQIIHPDFRVEVTKYFRDQIIKKRLKFDKELKIINVRTKQEKWVHGLGKFKFDKNNRVIEIFGTIHDISERVKGEIALRESEKMFRDMANLLPQGVFEHDLGGKITYANEQGLKLYGYSNNDLNKGINILETLIPEDRDRAKKNTEVMMFGKTPNDHEFTALRKDGSTFHVLIYSNTINKDDKPIGVRGIVIDNTANVEADKKMKSRNAELELWSEVAVGREFKIIELKKEINEILKKHGGQPKYKIVS